jgi:hypothetical protein
MSYQHAEVPFSTLPSLSSIKFGVRAATLQKCYVLRTAHFNVVHTLVM